MQAFFRRPVAFAAFLAVLTALVSYRISATVKPLLLLIISVLFVGLLIVALLKRGGKRIVEALLCLFAVAISIASSYFFFNVRYQAYRALEGQTVEVAGTVLERVSSTTFLTTYRVSLNQINDDATSVDAMLECNYQSAMQVGDTFVVKGEVRAFEKDEQFDEEIFRLSDGCLFIVTCDTRYHCEIGEKNQKDLRVMASRINERLVYRIFGRIGGQEGALSAALLLGNRTLLSGQTKLDFQYAGVSHLLALSGLHVSIIIGFVEFLLRSLWIGKRGRAVMVPMVALAYLTLTGFSPSTCRAVLMATVMYVALLFGERYDSFTALMLALFLTLSVTPYALLDLSLWMSYISAAAIVLIYPLIARSFDGWYQKRKPPMIIYRSLRSVVSALVIGTSANLALILLSAFVFGTSSLASVPTTLVLSLPVTALLILSVLSVLFPFVEILPMLCGAVAQLVLRVTEFFAGLEKVLLPLSDGLSIGVLLIMTAVMTVLALVRLRRFGWLLVPPLLFGVAVCASFYVTSTCFTELHVTEIQTGYGELYLYTQNGNAVLINDVSGAVSKDYEIKQAAVAQRCTVIDDVVICRYYNQATYFISSLSDSIRVGVLHMPTPIDAREEAIAARLAEEAAYYGIEVRFDAETLISDYMHEAIDR